MRRTKFDLKKALERAHLLEGLLIAEENIDEVIRIIRESYDDAKENLMQRFSLSDVQAQAILDMRLKALQGLEREKLQNEYDELEKRIAYFRELLADPEKVKAVLRDELIAIREGEIPQPGEKVYIHVETEKLHLFDRGTEKSLGYPEMVIRAQEKLAVPKLEKAIAQ